MRLVSERLPAAEQTLSARGELTQVESLKAFHLAEVQRIRERAQQCVMAMVRENPKAMVPSASFMSIPRDSSEFRSQLIKSISSTRMLPEDDSVISRNIKRVRALTPDAVARSRREKVAQETFRIRVARETSVHIREERRVACLQALQDKQRRHELRMMGDQLNGVVRGWVAALLILQQSAAMRLAIVRRKQLRTRTKRLVGLFYFCSRALGVIVLSLQTIRRRNAIKVLGRMRIYIRRWVQRRRRKYAELLADFLSLMLYQVQQRQIMERWLGSMRRVKRFLQALVRRRQAQVELIVLQWERHEAETLQDLRRRVGRRVTLSQRNAMTEVPRYIKEMQAIRHYRNLQFHFQKFIRTYWQHAGDRNSKESLAKPRFTVILAVDELLMLHKNALKTRHMWDTTLYHPRKT